MDINALFNLAVGTLYAYAIVAGVYALVKNQIRLRRHRRQRGSTTSEVDDAV